MTKEDTSTDSSSGENRKSSHNSYLQNTLHKGERLCAEVHFKALFDHGKSVNTRMMRVKWVAVDLQEGEKHPVKVGFSVPKRLYRKAHDRNLRKRWLKEAYRKHKHILVTTATSQQKQLYILFIYRSRIETTFQKIESDVISIVDMISAKLC